MSYRFVILMSAAVMVFASRAQQTTGIPLRLQPAIPDVIYTAAPVYDIRATLHGGERFPEGAQLLIVRGGKVSQLVPTLAASADASLSFDGATVLFAGKQKAGEPWGIWSVAVQGGTPRRVLNAATDLIRPLWLPAGRLVYARRIPEGFVLEAAALDGSATQRLSFVPGNYIPDDVLRDGRVLFESGFPLGAGSIPELYLVYSDGSGVESVRCDHQSSDRQHGRQLQSGDIVFTRGNHLARFTSALAEEVPVTRPVGDYAGDIAELSDGRWIVSVRIPGTKHYALHILKPGRLSGMALVRNPECDLVEPVIVAPHAVPNRHPSALHDWSKGNLLALDARLSRSGNLRVAPASVRVEALDSDGRIVNLGTAPVDSDGSFFVQATGDLPLRFILLDAQGRALRKEQGWLWVRRGEQRICVGCHTGPERAPDNRVPNVLMRSTTPAALNGAGEAPTAGGR